MMVRKFIDLTGSAAAQRRVTELASSFGVSLMPVAGPDSLQALETCIDAEKPAFLFVQPDAEFLTRSIGLRSVGHPPTLAMVGAPLSPPALESLRIRGVAAVITPQAEPGEASMLRGLCDSASWIRTRTGTIHLAQLLQSLEVGSRQTILVANRSSTSVFGQDWQRLQEPNWYGRICLADGQVQRVEVPSTSGALAFARLLELPDAVVTVQSVSLEPLQSETGVSIQAALMNAAVARDHLPREGQPPPRPPSATPPPPPAAAVAAIGRAVPRKSPGSTAELTSERPRSPGQQGVMPTDDATSSRAKLQALSNSLPNLKGVAVCRAGGIVRDLVGVIDADTRAAAAEMAHASVMSVGTLLGLGEPTGFVVETEREAAVVAYRGARFAVANCSAGGNLSDIVNQLGVVVETVG